VLKILIPNIVALNDLRPVIALALGRLRINPGFEPDKDPSQWIYLTPTP
jgi:hypothetical protein